MNETELKEEMNKRETPDSFTIGTAGKGGALKVYFNLGDLAETQKKVENLLKLKVWLSQQGVEV